MLTSAADELAMEEQMRPALPREMATKYYEKTNSWMHPFSGVRKDELGFFILHEDNPDGWRMKPGDLIQDVTLSEIPYWQVKKNNHQEKAVYLEPIGPNPFITGVGAGGAKITKKDIRVLTGEYEEERVQAIWDALDSGEIKNVSDVAYLLMGTVGVNFGPNGPQGGWYNPHDTMSNRGGRKGLSVEEIIIADAKTLSDLGFIISDEILNGNIDDYEWEQFISNSVGYFADWSETPPADTEIYKQRSLDDYRRRNLLDDEWRRDSLTKDLDAWEYAIELWIEVGGIDFDGLEKYNSEKISESLGIDRGFAYKIERHLKGMCKWSAFSTHTEDPSVITNAIALIDHPQADICTRAVSRCLMHLMSAYDQDVDSCYAALVRFLDEGKGNWLTNEKIILFFTHVIQNPQPLIVATKLPAGVNRKYAYWGLTTLRDDYVNKAVFTETDPEALGAIVSAFVYNGYMPGRHETYYLKEKLLEAIKSDELITRYQSRDALANLYPLLRKQGLEWEDAYRAVKEYDERIRNNPVSDFEWIEITRRHMWEKIRYAD